MAANEINLKEIMTDCQETEGLLEQLQQQQEDLYSKGEDYYEKYNSHPPVLLRDYIEASDRVDALQQQLEHLQSLSQEISPEFMACHSWLDEAKQGRFQCEINLFTRPHTERDLGKENNVLAATAPSTTLRFVYADDNNEVVDNGYIFYWVYDYIESDEIEDEDYTRFALDARPMLPVGVGRTDKDGHLRKSMMFRQKAFSHLKKNNKHYLQLKLQWDDINTAHLSNHVAPKDWAETMQKSQSQWNALGQLQGNRRFLLAHAKANRGHFEQNLSESERTLQDLYSFHLQQNDFDKAEAVIEQQGKKSGFVHRDFVKKVSNRYFYLFKAYGFMCYPIDRGSFLTKELKSLTRAQADKPAIAWKGYLKPDNSRTKNNADHIATVAIHCTLPEWDRRIQRQLRRLKSALDVHLDNQKAHQKIIYHLDGMLGPANLHKRFSVSGDDAEQAKMDTLIDNLKSIQDIIEAAQNGELSEDNPISMKAELDDVEAQATRLRDMLNSDALRDEFKRYWRDGPKTEDDPILKAGPDMQEEPYWVHFFHSYCEAIILLRNTPLGTAIFNEEISPLLDQLVAETDYNKLAPSDEVEDIIDKTNEFFAGQKSQKKDGENNIAVEKLWERIQTLNIQQSSEESNDEDETFEYQEKDSLIYLMLKGWRDSTNTLFHRVPGPPSVLQVILDVYADHISKKIQRDALSKGSYHIKLMLTICDFFGVFGEDDFSKNKDKLYTALRAHGRLHRKGGAKASGVKNYYSHTAMEARMQLLNGNFGENITPKQKADLDKVMVSVGDVKKFVHSNFYQRSFPGFAAKVETGSSFSDTVYSANPHFAYKGIMAVINLGFMVESWINLPKEKTRHWDEGEHLRYITSLSETLGATSLSAYKTARLATHYRLSTLVDKMDQAKKNSHLLWSKAEISFSDMSPFMDNLAVSLSLLAAVSAILDGFKYQSRGQVDKAMIKWLDAVSSSMVAYGFYAGKYAQKGAFAYLSGKVASRTSSLLSRAGIALFLPYIGELVALVGAVLSVLILVVDILEMISDYNKSILLQQFEHHFEALSKLDKDNYYKLKNGQLETQIKTIGDYDVFFGSDLDFNDLHLNALIPLRSLGYSLESIRDMLDNDNYYLIHELTGFYERLSDPELSGHYYEEDGVMETFPEIARRLNNGTFFDAGLSPYQQRELVLTHYSGYREYPRP